MNDQSIEAMMLDLKEHKEKYHALCKAVRALLCHHRIVAIKRLHSDTFDPRLELVESLLKEEEK